ncbi:non-ribosomal peptide synthetase-like protein [Rhizoctonia solani AG-3 Rhs1AP]|uniref:Non-ribosomal peptide synthetase-like protein n=1 Tax=Rhizoctonia solani AG-3 Rhs1AP TaxID=1086054 RepID=X8IWD1_9AGAM|nr:non-ribosomal peptide synthetase-like protein [Rhizoctonia solani AG-3 Rhs1AP]
MACNINQLSGANSADLECGLQGSSDPLSPSFGGGEFVLPAHSGTSAGTEGSFDSRSLVSQTKISALHLENSTPSLPTSSPPAFDSEKPSPSTELPSLPYQTTPSTQTITLPSPTVSLAPVEKAPSEKVIQGSVVPAPPALAAGKGKAKPSNVEANLWIRFNLFFNTYRKFYTFVVTLNGIGLILAGIGRFEYATNHSGALVLGNLLCAVMMRNELFTRFLYLIATALFAKWPPLCIRLGITSILQHVGGIHSGCATSGLAWLLYKVIELCRHASVNQKSVIAMGIVTSIAVTISVISAFPWIRNQHHNIFERHHRFIGWLGLLATWIFVILGNGFDSQTGEWTATGYHMISTQEFWFALGMTVFIVLPWTFTRRVPVHVEIPSPKVAVLRFDRGMQQGLLGRISRSSILEYHAFGIISEGTNSPYHYMVCGVQGDFTRGLVEDPPKYLWTRELKFAGVSNTSSLYRRGIRVCTGTGIGAALSTCIQNDQWFLIWIGSDQEKTFGKTISGLIEQHIPPERRILWDSKKAGRPNSVKLIEEVYRSFDAEVVFITSNYLGNREMMVGCRKLGIPAFGTLWDF